MVRYAFTMIELIFALVIMGIVFLTLPVILIQNADSVEDNIIQESIFLSSSKMSQLLTFQWDNNSREAGIILSAADVLTVSATGDSELVRATSDFRRGHFPEDKHRRMTPINNERNATYPIGIEGTVYDDIDDFDGLTNFNIITAPNVGGYKKRYRGDVNVTYVNDNTNYAADPVNFAFTTADAGDTTNIKMIETSIVQDRTGTGNWETSVLLRAYVTNIGETDYFKRRY